MLLHPRLHVFTGWVGFHCNQLPDVTPILNCLEYLVYVLNLVLDTLKFTTKIYPIE